MKTPPPAVGALVVSGTQSGNWTGYGAPLQGAPQMHLPIQGLQAHTNGNFSGYEAAAAANPGYGAGAQQYPPQQQQYPPQQQQYQQAQPQNYGLQQGYGAPQYQQQY